MSELPQQKEILASTPEANSDSAGQTMNEDQKRCFVVGPIGMKGSEVRRHADWFLNGVVKEVFEKMLQWYVFRADEISDPGMINDRVIHDLLYSDIVVADLTFANPNAFYELGIRHMAMKPVIHFAQEGEIIPFDTANHRTIVENLREYEGLIRARSRLHDAAKAVLKPAYKVSNPVSQARASFAVLESSDPKDKLIVDLIQRVERVETKARDTVLTNSTTDNAPPSPYLIMELTRFIQKLSGKKIQAAQVRSVYSDLRTVYSEDELTRRIKEGFHDGPPSDFTNLIVRSLSDDQK